ncbi:MAG: glycosyltransferase family 2 protein [Chloroflexi bacterium]|nr:glycosyltransferase family 2 protein [Chloroflexota bacterium]
MEPVVRGQGYKVYYVPEAIVYNKGPENVDDFLRQRRRIYAGHLDVQNMLGYAVSTMSGGKVLKLFLKELDWQPSRLSGLGASLSWRLTAVFSAGVIIKRAIKTTLSGKSPLQQRS